MSHNQAMIATLHSSIQLPCADFLFRCAAEDLPLTITCGFRSYAGQLEAWQKGRDKDGNIVDPTKVVTKARPGSSWHNFGLAFDVAFEGQTWDRMNSRIWEAKWTRIGEIGEAVDLEWGGRFKTMVDRPHFQRPKGITLEQARNGLRPPG